MAVIDTIKLANEISEIKSTLINIIEKYEITGISLVKIQEKYELSSFILFDKRRDLENKGDFKV